MIWFLLAFLAIVLVGIGARDQLLVATLSARQAQRPALLLISSGSAGLAAFAVLWLGSNFAAQVDPAARPAFAALAMALAAIEMLVIRPRAVPAEPTASLGAFAIVMLARQLTDAARFLLFAIIVASPFPGATALGGALGGMTIVAIGWGAGQSLVELPLRRVRQAVGAILLLAALLSIAAIIDR